MLRRSQQINIPVDILRTVAMIVDIGSYSKVGERLGLTQPAITAQIKRFQVLVGGPVFERTASGVTLNDRGKLMMPLIRKVLETNDQILEFGGAAHDPRPIRLGLSDLYLERFLKGNVVPHQQINIACDHSSDLLRGMADGYIDICALLRPSADAGTVIETWREPFVWVRGHNFTLSPGAPVPLVGWPGLLSDNVAISVLESKGIAYRLAFTSYDRTCRLAAVAAGIGVLIMPKWAVPEEVREAREYYLPHLPMIEAGVMVRHGVDVNSVSALIKGLRMLRQEEGTAERAANRSHAAKH